MSLLSLKRLMFLARNCRVSHRGMHRVSKLGNMASDGEPYQRGGMMPEELLLLYYPIWGTWHFWRWKIIFQARRTGFPNGDTHYRALVGRNYVLTSELHKCFASFQFHTVFKIFQPCWQVCVHITQTQFKSNLRWQSLLPLIFQKWIPRPYVFVLNIYLWLYQKEYYHTWWYSSDRLWASDT